MQRADDLVCLNSAALTRLVFSVNYQKSFHKIFEFTREIQSPEKPDKTQNNIDSLRSSFLWKCCCIFTLNEGYEWGWHTIKEFV